MHRPLLRLATPVDFRLQMPEHQVLAANLLAIKLATEFRPVTLVLSLGRLLPGPVRITKQRRHQLLRRTLVPIHRVHAADARHLLLVRLLAFGSMSAGWFVFDGPYH